MKTLKRLKFIVLFIIILFLILICCIITPINLQFEYVDKILIEYNEEINSDTPWFTVVNEEYAPLFGLGNLQGSYGVDVESVQSDFDLNNYSYVVCYGHELNRLTYSYLKPKRRKGIIPYELTAKATLSSEKQNYIFIYRIKKANIVCNYHDMDSCTEYR